MDYRHADNPVPFSTARRTHRADAAMLTDGPGPGTGVLLDADGSPPPGSDGLHCRHCGGEIGVPFVRGLHDCVQEYRHTGSGTVHCVVAREDGRRTGFAEETAAPCREPGCMPGARHEEAARPD